MIPLMLCNKSKRYVICNKLVYTNVRGDAYAIPGQRSLKERNDIRIIQSI